MDLKDLHNPNNITAILHDNGDYIVADTDQGFQEYPKSIELWQLRNGLLYRVKRWYKRNIVATY